LPRRLQAEAVVPACEIEATAIVTQVQANLPVVENKFHVELTGLRVAQSIGQYFLSDAEEILFPFRRNFPWLALQNEFRPHRCALGHLLDQTFQSVAQIFFLQRLRTKRPQGTPRLAQALAGEFAGTIEISTGFHR
jgi:hypothetical protein